MRAWTVHSPPPPPAASVPPSGPASVPATGGAQARPRRNRRAPGLVLVPEGFSLVAALLPPLWFLRHGMWLVLVLYLALAVLAALLLPGALRPYAWLGAHWLAGLQAQDLRRWTLARRGLPAAAVVLGADEESALLRALAARPALARAEAGAMMEGKAA